jgi:hypothetical protein
MKIKNSQNIKSKSLIINNNENKKNNKNENNLILITNNILNLTPKRKITYQPKMIKTEINYKTKYEKIRNKIYNIKQEILQERINGNELIKEFNKLLIKEKMYDEINKENNYLIGDNNKIEEKLKESENKIKEQILKINTYKIELNGLINMLNINLKKK